MVNKENKINWYAVALVVVSIVGIYFLVQLDLSQKNIPIIEEPKAILNAQLTNWAENLYDSSEMFFVYTLYNYGDAQAKNIEVTCKIYDYKDVEIFSDKENIGNIASNDYKIGELVTNNIPTDPDELYTPICYVSNCDNCEILWKNIPSLSEYFN